MIDFTLRNLSLFFRDRIAVVFSVMGELIIVILYVLFMRDDLLSSFSSVKNAELLIDVWMISGIIAVTAVTASMGAYGIMVDDRNTGVLRDLCTAPVHKPAILYGYIFSAAAIGIILMILTLVISEIYLVCKYDTMAGGENLVKIYILIIVNAVSNSAMMILIVSFVKSSSGLAACCTVIGALIGFLTGIYIPLGAMTEEVQMIVKCFPASHGAALFRQEMIKPLAEQCFQNNEQMEWFVEYMGVEFFWDGKMISWEISILYLILAAIISVILTVLKMTKI